MLKYLPGVEFWCVLILFVVMLSQAVGVDTKTNELPDITAKSITVKSDVGGSISLQSTKQGPGIWLTSPNGDTVAITAFADHCGVMLLPKDGVGGASPLALAISGKSAYIQVRDKNDRVVIIPVEKLGRAAAWLQTQPKE